MKILLLFVLLSCFVFLGVCVYLFYLSKYRIYKDMVYICSNLKNSITYTKNDISSILNSINNRLSITTKSYLRNGLKREHSVLYTFFNSLGSGDVSYEINNIEYYENIFKDKLQEAKDDMTKKGMLYLKLLIALGLVICIILI